LHPISVLGAKVQSVGLHLLHRSVFIALTNEQAVGDESTQGVANAAVFRLATDQFGNLSQVSALGASASEDFLA
jgi:hypothetical protein